MSLALSICAIGAAVLLAVAIAFYFLHGKKGIVKNEVQSTVEKHIDTECSVLKKYIPNFVMVPSFRAYSKKEAIEKLVEIAGKELPEIVCNVEHAKQAVFNREESMPTGLDNGIAVPHGRTDGVNQIAGVLAIVDNSENDNGVIPDYDTIDHSKIQILSLTLIPASINTPYLQLIAAFIRVLQDEENREQLLSCKTSEEMRSFLSSII